MKPFFWNIKRKEQLGSLLVGEKAFYYKGFLDELSLCSSYVLSRSEGKKMIFVGRSAESIYYYLLGILEDTSMRDNLTCLNISNRYYAIDDLYKHMPDAYVALKLYFTLLGITPKALTHSSEGVCFVDLVAEGNTFDRLYEFMSKWCEEEGINLKHIWKKIKFLGIVSRTKNSPNAFRWYQDAIWVEDRYNINAQSISISYKMWQYMGNHQHKVSRTNKPEYWATDKIAIPSRRKENLQALRLEYHIYHKAISQRSVFKSQISKTFEYKSPWLRTLMGKVK